VLVLFTILGPIAVGVAVGIIRRAVGPQMAMSRMRRGKPARIPVSVNVPAEADTSGWVARVGDEAHIVAEPFHWVMPAGELTSTDLSRPIRMPSADGWPPSLSVKPRWRRPLELAMAPQGPRWSAASEANPWFAPAWTVTVLLALLAAAAAATMLAGTHRLGTFSYYDPPGGSCFVYATEPGFPEYFGWVLCFAQPSADDPMGFITLPWPFDGVAFSLEVAVTAVAVPTLLALVFAAGHLRKVRSRHATTGQPVHVGAEPPGREQQADDWLNTYLPEVARKLDWPDLPAETAEPDDGIWRLPFDRRAWRYGALRAGDGRWMLLLSGVPDAKPTWVLQLDRQPALRGTAFLPRDAPSSGWLMVLTDYSRRTRKAMGLRSADWFAAYQGLEKVDEFTLASLREDIEAQLRDHADGFTPTHAKNVSADQDRAEDPL